MLSVKKQYRVGTIVSWQSASTVRSGTIEAVYMTPTKHQNGDGSEYVDASLDNPAYEITQMNGTKVFKRHAQLLKTDA